MIKYNSSTFDWQIKAEDSAEAVQYFRPMVVKRKNKDFNPNNCGVTHFLNRIGGKWKVLIIYAISIHCNRFSLLKKGIPAISKQTLVNQLRELEEDGIIERIIYSEVPPKVEYKITEYGWTLMPIIQVIQEWGVKDLAKSLATIS